MADQKPADDEMEVTQSDVQPSTSQSPSQVGSQTQASENLPGDNNDQAPNPETPMNSTNQVSSGNTEASEKVRTENSESVASSEARDDKVLAATEMKASDNNEVEASTSNVNEGTAETMTSESRSSSKEEVPETTVAKESRDDVKAPDELIKPAVSEEKLPAESVSGEISPEQQQQPVDSTDPDDTVPQAEESENKMATTDTIPVVDKEKQDDAISEHTDKPTDVSKQADTDISKQADADFSKQADTEISKQADTSISKQPDTDVSKQADTDISRQAGTADDAPVSNTEEQVEDCSMEQAEAVDSTPLRHIEVDVSKQVDPVDNIPTKNSEEQVDKQIDTVGTVCEKSTEEVVDEQKDTVSTVCEGSTEEHVDEHEDTVGTVQEGITKEQVDEQKETVCTVRQGNTEEQVDEQNDTVGAVLKGNTEEQVDEQKDTVGAELKGNTEEQGDDDVVKQTDTLEDVPETSSEVQMEDAIKQAYTTDDVQKANLCTDTEEKMGSVEEEMDSVENVKAATEDMANAENKKKDTEEGMDTFENVKTDTEEQMDTVEAMRTDTEEKMDTVVDLQTDTNVAKDSTGSQIVQLNDEASVSSDKDTSTMYSRPHSDEQIDKDEAGKDDKGNSENVASNETEDLNRTKSEVKDIEDAEMKDNGMAETEVRNESKDDTIGSEATEEEVVSGAKDTDGTEEPNDPPSDQSTAEKSVAQSTAVGTGDTAAVDTTEAVDCTPSDSQTPPEQDLGRENKGKHDTDVTQKEEVTTEIAHCLNEEGIELNPETAVENVSDKVSSPAVKVQDDEEGQTKLQNVTSAGDEPTVDASSAVCETPPSEAGVIQSSEETRGSSREEVDENIGEEVDQPMDLPAVSSVEQSVPDVAEDSKDTGEYKEIDSTDVAADSTKSAVDSSGQEQDVETAQKESASEEQMEVEDTQPPGTEERKSPGELSLPVVPAMKNTNEEKLAVQLDIQNASTEQASADVQETDVAERSELDSVAVPDLETPLASAESEMVASENLPSAEPGESTSIDENVPTDTHSGSSLLGAPESSLVELPETLDSDCKTQEISNNKDSLETESTMNTEHEEASVAMTTVQTASDVTNVEKDSAEPGGVEEKPDAEEVVAPRDDAERDDDDDVEMVGLEDTAANTQPFSLVLPETSQSSPGGGAAANTEHAPEVENLRVSEATEATKLPAEIISLDDEANDNGGLLVIDEGNSDSESDVKDGVPGASVSAVTPVVITPSQTEAPRQMLTEAPTTQETEEGPIDLAVSKETVSVNVEATVSASQSSEGMAPVSDGSAASTVAGDPVEQPVASISTSVIMKTPTVTPEPSAVVASTSATDSRSSTVQVSPDLQSSMDKVKAGANTSSGQSPSKRDVGWTTIEGVLVPYLSRGSTKYVSVKMVENKMLSKYPSIDLDDMKDAGPIYSYYVTREEAAVLTEINAKCYKHAFGTDPFTTQDLIVSLQDFQNFYKNIRLHFEKLEKAKLAKESGAKEELTRQKTAQDRRQAEGQRKSRKQSGGNWIQINNTVCPFVQRGDYKFVPLSVVRFAARLLLGKDYSAHKVAITPLEIQMLNMLCKNAGVNFSFDVRTTKLIRLETVSQMMHPERISIRPLTKKHPFETAVYHKELERSHNGMPNGTQQTTAASQASQSKSPASAAARRPQLNPQENPALLQLRQMVTSHVQPRSMSGAQVTVSSMAAASHSGPVMPPQAVGAASSLGAAPRPSHSTPRPPPQPITIAPIDSRHIPGAPPPPSVHHHHHQQQQQNEPRPGPSSSSLSHAGRGHTSAAAPGEPLIKPVRLSGKTVSCILRPATGERYALVEALARLYFPQCSLQEFQKALQDLLKIPLAELTPAEEQEFINFYDLPVRSLKCKTIAPILSFEAYFQHLKYLFKDKKAAAKASAPAATHQSQHASLQSQHASAAATHQSQHASAAAAHQSQHASVMGQQARGPTPTPSEGSRSSTPSEGSGPGKRPASADSLGGAGGKKQRPSPNAPQKKLGNVLAKLKERQEHQLNRN